MKKSMRILKDVSEAELIRLLQTYITSSPFMGSNEDAYLIRDQRPYMLINIDSMQRDGDFLPQQTWNQIGKKLVTITFSDLVTKGAYPEYFLSSLILEETMQEENLKELVGGIQEEVHLHKANYLGGDLGSASETVLTGIGIGSIPQGDILTRRNAQISDYVCVTGYFGLTAIGFNHLLPKPEKFSPELPSHLLEKAINKIYQPTLRLAEGTLLSSYQLASAAIDSSDGLGSSLNWLAEESSIRIIIDHLPLEPALVEHLPSPDLLQDVTFFGGEEYEIIFTVPPNKLKQTKELFKQHNCKCIVIGKCSKGEGVFHKTSDKLENIPLYGWDSIQNQFG